MGQILKPMAASKESTPFSIHKPKMPSIPAAMLSSNDQHFNVSK